MFFRGCKGLMVEQMPKLLPPSNLSVRPPQRLVFGYVLLDQHFRRFPFWFHFRDWRAISSGSEFYFRRLIISLILFGKQSLRLRRLGHLVVLPCKSRICTKQQFVLKIFSLKSKICVFQMLLNMPYAWGIHECLLKINEKLMTLFHFKRWFKRMLMSSTQDLSGLILLAPFELRFAIFSNYPFLAI